VIRWTDDRKVVVRCLVVMLYLRLARTFREVKHPALGPQAQPAVPTTRPSGLEENPEAQGGGFSSASVWPRADRYTPSAHRQQRLRHLLVVRLGAEANKRSPLWRLPTLETGGSGPEEVDGEGEGAEAWKGGTDECGGFVSG
jgi:hypothetical protein